MKRILLFVVIASVLSSLLLPMNVIAATGSSDDEEDTYWPGINFKSISEFEAYLSKCRQNNSFDEIGEFYSTIDSIYIPKALKNHSDAITGVAAEFYNYYIVQYKFESTTVWLSTSYSSWGKSGYEFAKELFNTREEENSRSYLPQKSDVGGNTVYFYYSLGETFYYWQQNGVYYELRINKKPNDKYLVYCDVVSIPLNINPAPGNINDNPGTGR